MALTAPIALLALMVVMRLMALVALMAPMAMLVLSTEYLDGLWHGVLIRLLYGMWVCSVDEHTVVDMFRGIPFAFALVSLMGLMASAAQTGNLSSIGSVTCLWP